MADAKKTKLFVICLDKTFEKRCKPTLDKLKTCHSNIEVIQFEAVRGDTVDHALLHPFAAKTALTGRRDIHDQFSHINQVGCSLSHINLWKKAIQLGEPILVAEDDQFNKNTCDMLNYFNHIEPHMGFVSLNNGKQKTSAYSDKFNRLHRFVGTGLYYITPDTAARLLEYALPVVTHIDIFISDCIEPTKLEAYSSLIANSNPIPAGKSTLLHAWPRVLKYQVWLGSLSGLLGLVVLVLSILLILLYLKYKKCIYKK
jgi:GR25 family glycosyltransferase involved in LPS biosynthesis